MSSQLNPDTRKMMLRHASYDQLLECLIESERQKLQSELQSFGSFTYTVSLEQAAESLEQHIEEDIKRVIEGIGR